MKKTIKNGAIFALSILMLAGCSSTSNSSTPTPEETETIEITIDNWQDYFEIKEDYSYYYNGFDEISEMYKVYNFYLKDGMTFVEDSCQEIAVEYEYDMDYDYTFANVDWEKGTFDYSPLDDETLSKYGISNSHIPISDTTTLSSEWDNDAQAYSSNYLGSIFISYGVYKKNGETQTNNSYYTESGDLWTIPKPDNLAITRIKGTIEIVK